MTYMHSLGKSSTQDASTSVAQPELQSNISETSQAGAKEKKEKLESPLQSPAMDEVHASSDKASTEADEPIRTNSPVTELGEKVEATSPSHAADKEESDVDVSISEELEEEEEEEGGKEEAGNKEHADHALVLDQKTSKPLTQDASEREDCENGQGKNGQRNQEAPTEQSSDKNCDQHSNGTSQQPNHLKPGSGSPSVSNQAVVEEKKHENLPAVGAAAGKEGVLAPTSNAVYGTSAPKPPRGYEVHATFYAHAITIMYALHAGLIIQ